MTRNNLDEHLSWLLHAKPSIPVSNPVFPPVSSAHSETVSLAELGAPQSRTSELAAPIHDTAVGGSGERTAAAPARGLLAQEPVLVRNSGDDMARLRTAPGSPSKPRLITPGTSVQQPTPVTAGAPGVARRPNNDGLGAGPMASATRRPQTFSVSPSGVEILDMTDGVDQCADPTPSRLPAPRTGRKRKTDEFAADMPRKEPRIDSIPGSQNERHAYARASPGFPTIEELAQQPPIEPPPPYSTIPPAMFVSSSADYQRNGAPTGNVLRTISTSGAFRGMHDSEDDDDVATCTDLGLRTKGFSSSTSSSKLFVSPRKPAAVLQNSPPKQNASRLHNQHAVKGDTAGATHDQIIPHASPSRAAVAILGAQSSATQTASDQQFAHLALNDATSLKALLACEDASIDMIIYELRAKSESIGDEAARIVDNGLEADDEILEMEQLDRAILKVEDLLRKKQEHPRLSAERQQAFEAMKLSLKTKQGMQGAREANAECKKRLQDLEIELVTLIHACRDPLRDTLEAAQRSSVAVHSTQAYPNDNKTSDVVVPSSSRIAQTQMAKQTEHARPRQLCDPSPSPFGLGPQISRKTTQRLSPARLKPEDANLKDIVAHFSPSRKAARNQTYPHPDLATIQSHGKKERSPLRSKTPKDEYASAHIASDNTFGMDSGLFSTRMGTPDHPCRDFEDEYDFGDGCDDDEMLEIAADVEHRGHMGVSLQGKPSRSVLTETSGNNQPRVQQSISAKIRRTPSKSVDAPLEELFRFPWSEDVKVALKERFRLRGFREHQLEAINSTLGGKDTFVLMPTGGGKSLCYQLPALIRSGETRGVTVVISPLLSLMEDQVQHLRDLSIQAFLINGETSADDRKHILDALRERDVEDFVQLLYVTPEMLSKSQAIISSLEQLHQRQRLARIVIDEAHCVSQWGHDFRPDYKQLGDVRKRFPRVPVMALTATATENVRVDVIHNLGIQGCQIFTRSFNRSNLYYEVRQKGKGKEDLDSIATLIKNKYAKQTGIIYCLSRKKCEETAKALDEQHNIKATHYHAGMEPEKKSAVQRKWQQGGYHVIVATIAFGMGIDKANVRFVIHHSIPKSLEGYYQETGRAGRDGKRSGCYLYYGYQDASILRRMISDGEGSYEQKERQFHMLSKMIQFCENRSDCRRVQVLAYFNERFHRDQCEGQCDNCNSTSRFEMQDFTKLAVSAVSIVEKTANQRVTVNHCIEIFRGAPPNKKMKDLGHKDLPEYGVGSDLDRGDIERLFSRLLSEDAIAEENHVNKTGFAHQYAKLGRNWQDYAQARRSLKLQIRVTPNAKAKESAPKRKKAGKSDAAEKIKRWNNTAGSVAGAAHPMSTNVSSPVQAASKRKKARTPDEVHRNSYVRAKFVSSDTEGKINEESADDDDEAFEPIRIAGKPTRERKKRQLGPPITMDDKISRLNPTHQMVVEGFVIQGKRICQDIVIDKGLRAVPFTDTMLREMAIGFPQNEAELNAQIPGIDPDKVHLYGRRFLKLIRESHRSYEEMMQQQEEERPNDPNAQNVIDLVSEDEDEYGSAADFEDMMEDEEDGGEPSSYFQPNPEVAAFNNRISHSQSAAMRTSVAAPANKGNKAARKKSFRPKKYAYKKSGDNNHGSYGGSAGGVTKRRTAVRRSGRGGISMMPT